MTDMIVPELKVAIGLELHARISFGGVELERVGDRRFAIEPAYSRPPPRVLIDHHEFPIGASRSSRCGPEQSDTNLDTLEVEENLGSRVAQSGEDIILLVLWVRDRDLLPGQRSTPGRELTKLGAQSKGKAMWLGLSIGTSVSGRQSAFPSHFLDGSESIGGHAMGPLGSASDQGLASKAKYILRVTGAVVLSYIKPR